MRRKIHAGSTSVMIPVYIQDTSSSTGSGLSGLLFNTAGLVAEYRREGSATWTPITLVAGTLGTFVAGGFVVDGALPGSYEFGVPNAALAASTRWAFVRLYGATNMRPVMIEIELDAVDYQDANAFGLTQVTATNTAVGRAIGLPITVVADAGNSTTSVTVSGLSTASIASYAVMRILWMTGTVANVGIDQPITGAIVNGSNVKLTWAVPLASIPSAGTPDTGVLI